MKPFVFNSTPLIFLTKIGLSSLYESLKGDKFTSPTVKFEVVDQGKSKGIADAIILEKIIIAEIIKIIVPKDKAFLDTLLKTKGLHTADAEVLTLAKEQEGIAVIDDGIVRMTAKIYSISYIGTASILINSVYQKIITKEQAKQTIKDIIRIGWRCSIETFTQILEILDKID